MFKKSRRRIVASIMLILVLLWLGTLAGIYATSYFEVNATNREMLEEHAAMYALEKPLGGFEANKPAPGRDHHAGTDRFKLSTFYSVAFSHDGEVLETKNKDIKVFTDSELVAMAREILTAEEDTGRMSSLIYCRRDKGEYMLVSFMDNTILQDSMGTLFRYTLIIGAAALAALFVLAVFLARKIVQPLEESYRKQKQFISDAGHELKTPVSIVSANAELLARRLGDDPWLDNIRHENERMGNLITQLLDLARTEHTKPRMELLDFSRLAAGDILPFESMAYEKGLLLNTRIPPGITVMGSRTQLSQLVSILMDNAIHHSKNGGEITVRLTQTRTAAVLSVSNPGDPIPPETARQLFERFYRADEARSGGGHYGLGLPIAKAIAEAHGGRIELCCGGGLVEFRASVAKG